MASLIGSPQSIPLESSIDETAILLIEDSPEYADAAEEMLRESGPNREVFALSRCGSLQSARRWLTGSRADCVLLDLSLPDGRGLSVLREVQETAPDTPIVILSATEEEGVAVEAVQVGAQDYLVKTHIDGYLLRRSIKYAIGRKQMEVERRNAEQALHEAEEGFRRAFDDSPIGIALFDLGSPCPGRFVQFNRALCEITGYDEEELATADFQAMTHPDDFEAERPLLEQLLAGEIPNYEIEKRYVRPDGGVVWVTHYASTVHDHRGKLLYGIGQVEDIGDRKQAEQRLATTAKKLERRSLELERSNDDLQRFAYVASHDLSEPLRMVSSYVQLLARRYKGQLDSDADDFIGFALDGTERMQALINGVLTYSRAGTAEYTIETVDCSSLVESTIAVLRGKLDAAGAEVTFDELPSIEGDSTQLMQLFQNLICNAIKFVNDEQPRVHISAHRGPDTWRFSVEDNGIGIEPRFTARIFEVFERLHGQTAYPGSGVGLALCKRVVERHDGRIWVEPRGEGGSKFFFTIPDPHLDSGGNGQFESGGA